MPARRRPSAAEIREKTPIPKSRLPKRDSVAAKRKRKSGVADSAVTERKPPSNRVTPKKKTAQNKGGTGASSGQKPAVRKRAAAHRPTRARKQNATGKQARKKTYEKRSGTK